MEEKADIHNFPRRLKLIENKIKKSKISKENKRIISQFTERCFKDNLSYAVVVKYLNSLYDIAIWTGKNFTSLTKKDLDKLFSRLETGEIKTKPIYKKIKGKKELVRPARKYKPQSIRKHKVVISRLFGIKHGIINKPELLKGMVFGNYTKEILHDDLWNPEEMLKLIGAGNNSRDQCLIAMLCEMGGRIGEILPIKIRNLTKEEDGSITLRTAIGKTGARTDYLFWSASYVQKWLAEHPDSKNKDNFLFPNTFGELDLSRPISYNSVRKILRRARKKCGIDKPCNPHNFRHSEVTNFITSGGNPEMAKLKFWGNQRTQMLSRYAHLNEEDLKREEMRVRGIIPKRSEKYEDRQCPKCHAWNRCKIEETQLEKGKINITETFLNKECANCGYILDVKEREIIRQNKQQELESQMREEILRGGSIQSPDMINVVWDLLKLVKFKDKKSEAKVNKVLKQYRMKYFKKSNVKIDGKYVPILDQHA